MKDIIQQWWAAIVIFAITVIALFGVYQSTRYCEDYGTMRDETTQRIGEMCYVKQGKAWVTKAAYDEKVDNLYKQDRL